MISFSLLHHRIARPLLQIEAVLFLFPLQTSSLAQTVVRVKKVRRKKVASLTLARCRLS
jgi:hypothetical protein